MKRKPSDLQTVPSESMMNLTDYGMRVDSYIPQQRDVKHWDTRNSHNRFSGRVTSPQSCHSEDLSYRNGNVHGNLTEINNNKLSKHTGSRMYSSHMDIYRTPPTLSYIKENSENCVIRSDEMYSDESVKKKGSLNSNDPESVSRAHSVGDLSTGLTLSVVGQRKADSIQCLSGSNNSTFKPVAIDNGNVKKSTGKTYPTSDSKRKESARKCAENKKDLQNTLRDLLTNISETKERECAKTQNANSNSNKRDTTTTPIKPKRALPSVPQGQADDRKKHYTEMVKIRMSEHSRNGQSSSSRTSSSVRTVLDTPLDKEVSDYLGNDRESCPGMLENVQFKENNGNISHRKSDNLHHDTLNVSIPLSVRSCDSGQATITSLSSTVDSGYLTNDAENDMYSSTSYTKCLQKSAQNFYSKKTSVIHSQSLHNESSKHLQETAKSAKHLQESAKQLQESVQSTKHLQEGAKSAKYLQESAIPVPGHLRNERTTISFKEKDINSRMRTFPRSGHSTSISSDNYLESIASKVIQETQKSKLKVCDKPMKYSSMKQLPTSDLMAEEGQRLQQPKSQVQNISVFKSEIDELKQINKSEVINVKTKVAKTVNCESSSRSEGDGQIPVTESHYNTLPGNWKYQNNQNLDNNSVKRLPSLHQLSQAYRFIPVTLSIGLEYNILDHLHLCENCVMLQNTKKNLKRESPAMSPPQGKYARLGGPGSAFKPVKVSDTSMYSVISVKEVSNVFHHKILQKGDILIEVCNCLVYQ